MGCGPDLQARYEIDMTQQLTPQAHTKNMGAPVSCLSNQRKIIKQAQPICSVFQQPWQHLLCQLSLHLHQ